MKRVHVIPDAIISNAYKKYGVDLLRHCRYRNFSSEDAEEIVQETFISAWKYLQRNEVENMRAFLFRIANNLIVDRVRKTKKEKKISLEALAEQGIEMKEAENEAQNANQRLDARKLMMQLKATGSTEDHELLNMRYFDGLMPADIASKKGMPSNTISVRLHRALKKVAEFLEYGQF